MKKNNTFKANLLLLIIIVLFLFESIILEKLSDNLGLALSQYFSILVPCIVYIIINKRGFKNTLRLNKMNFKSIILSIGIILVTIPVINLLSLIGMSIFGNQIMESIGDMITSAPFPLTFFAIAITPAICEEVLFRGIIMDGYRNVNYKKMIVLNGILFGLFHMNFNQFIYTVYLGIVIAYVVYITNSIYAGILMHFINNAFAIIAYKVFSDTTTQPVESAAIPIELVIIATICIVITVFLLKQLKKNNPIIDKDVIGEEVIEEEKIINWPLIVFSTISILFSILIVFTTLLTQPSV